MSSPVCLALIVIAAVAAYVLATWLGRGRQQGAREAGRLQAESELRPQIAVLEERLASAEAEGRRREVELSGVRAEAQRQGATVTAQAAEVARLEAELKAAREGARQRIEDEGAMSDRFDALARRALSANSTTFLETARKSFEVEQETARGTLAAKHEAFLNTLEPIEQQMQQLNQRVERLSEDKEKLAREAQSLSNALRKAEVRGRWGELQLQRIAELAGMKHRCDFELQASFTDEDEQRRRPDMVVNLPLGRYVVVDSKAVMDAYVAACAHDDAALRAQCLAQHARNVRAKIDDLARVDYARVLQKQDKNVADMVVCFIPGEDFFSAALTQDPLLLEYAASRSVFLASPTTLIVLLRAIALGWRDHELSENAEHVRKLGRELYARLSTMKDHFDRLGTAVDSTVKHYNSMVSSLNTRVFPQARKFQALGAIDTSTKEVTDSSLVEKMVADHASADWSVFSLAAGEDEHPVEN